MHFPSPCLLPVLNKGLKVPFYLDAIMHVCTLLLGTITAAGLSFTSMRSPSPGLLHVLKDWLKVFHGDNPAVARQRSCKVDKI